VAVRLDIRPRLTLPPERQARPRRRFRLPPLALPAAGYWLAMGALTYVFAHLGSHPFDSVEAAVAEHAEPAALPAPADEQPITPVEPAAEPVAATAPEAAPATEPEPAVVGPELADAAPATAAERKSESETRENREAGRRGDFWGSRAAERNEPEEPKPQEPARVAMSFPEFTDSSRPAKREHAADGPRIDSLFEKADERPVQGSEPAPPAPSAPPETAPDAPVVVSSCEAAIARNNEQITIGAARGAADTTRETYASILQNGRYLSACSIPERTVFEICAAVKDGRAIGITVVSTPSSPKLNACVRSSVARLEFPRNRRLDVTHTRFDAAAH
jgi:hypothetical protein